MAKLSGVDLSRVDSSKIDSKRPKKVIKPYSATWVHRHEKIKAAREEALARSLNDPFSEVCRHRSSFKHDKAGLSSGLSQLQVSIRVRDNSVRYISV